MADAVAHALANGKHLIAEAGTGVGKSFAYLVPAILHATEDQQDEPKAKEASEPADDEDCSRRIVVSTHTISLQEQLIEKDLPLLNSVIPREFSSVLVKGRNNYISLRRLDLARARAVNLLNESETEQLHQLSDWVKTTNDGSLSTVPFRPYAGLWDEVGSDSTNCLGKNCPRQKDCFYYRARRRVFGAQILVANHALFFTDLALRHQVGYGVLPDYDAAILDECHTIESVASSHLGLKITNGQVEYCLNKLYNPSTGKGLFTALGLQTWSDRVASAHRLSDQLVFDLDQWMDKSSSAVRVNQPRIAPNPLTPALLELSHFLESMADNATDASRRQDLISASQRLELLGTSVRRWIEQMDEGFVYWTERSTTRRGALRMEMHAAPVDISTHLRTMLFQEVPSVILASATISTGHTGTSGSSGGFEFFQSRVGATGSSTIKLGSPFNYSEQAELIVVRDMPDPSNSREQYEAALPRMIARYLLHTGGHAFVLFTSYGLLRKTASQMQTWFAEHGLSLYSQAEGTPRGQLLDQFKKNPRGALFGTDSFWQGVDVPGDALGNVIITKLPFSVPDHPLLQARLDAIREAGGNPFRDYQIPEAVIKLRQGFGRLIRTASDRGIVVILDSRVNSKYYGRTFLAALPECKISQHSIHTNPNLGSP
ncbi:MAG: helicase [Planctomycetales bacterium]|nr:helicase [Planctomycetales bacterium]